MNESGFVDLPEAGQTSLATGHSAWRRRLGAAALGVVVLAGLGWLVLERQHVANVAGYEALVEHMRSVDRGHPPLLHSERPPCGDQTEGVYTRQYSPRTGPTPEELERSFIREGWQQAPPTPPALSAFTLTEGDRTLEARITAPGPGTRADVSLVATSEASALGCLFR
jgi:hypothetical protein